MSNFTSAVANEDITPPGRITDVQVIDITSNVSSTGSTRNYTITWTATGDDVNLGQGILSHFSMFIGYFLKKNQDLCQQFQNETWDIYGIKFIQADYIFIFYNVKFY